MLAHRLIFETDASDPVTCLELSPVNGAVAVGTAAGAVRIIVDMSCVVLCRRSEEAIGCIYVSHAQVIATVGDVCVKRWSLGNLRADSPPVAGAVHESFSFPFSHSYGQCSTATCLMSGANILLSRGNVDREIFYSTTPVLENGQIKFDAVLQGPAECEECWPVAYDGDRVVFLASCRVFSVWRGAQCLCEFSVSKHEDRRGAHPIGLACLLDDRLVAVVHGRLQMWNLQQPSLPPVFLPHLHGWRRRVVHFCLSKGADVSHVTLATLGSDRTICFFEGAVDELVFKKRVSVAFARFHMELPYFMRVLTSSTEETSVCFNDDVGVHLVDVSSRGAL